MEKIPTAEAFLKMNNIKAYPIDTQMMIEFAKLHVEAAIKECIESAPSGSSTDTVSYEDVVKALKDCYPLSNIK
jgi:hypothetical protein